MMRLVGGGNDRRTGDGWQRQKGVRVVEATPGRDAMEIAEALEAIGSRIGDRHESEAFGMVKGPFPIDVVPSLTRPDQDRIGHELGAACMASGYRVAKAPARTATMGRALPGLNGLGLPKPTK